MLRTQLKLCRLLVRHVVVTLIAMGHCAALEATSYTSPGGEYSVSYPSTWVHYPEAKSLYILNFPLTRIVKEILLPEHGAMITFANTRPTPHSLEEWIESDAKRRGAVERRSFAVQREGQSSALSVTEIISHSTRGTLEFEEVDWYFSVDGNLFDAVLLYRGGDLRKSEYLLVLNQVVSSLKAERRQP
jgi:hypothetical protein